MAFLVSYERNMNMQIRSFSFSGSGNIRVALATYTELILHVKEVGHLCYDNVCIMSGLLRKRLASYFLKV